MQPATGGERCSVSCSSVELTRSAVFIGLAKSSQGVGKSSFNTKLTSLASCLIYSPMITNASRAFLKSNIASCLDAVVTEESVSRSMTSAHRS